MTVETIPTPEPSRRRHLLGPIVASLLTLQLACRIVPEFRPGLGGMIWWYFGLGLVPPTALIVLGLAVVVALFRRPFLTRRRVYLWTLLGLIGVSSVVFQRYPSSFDGRPSAVAFRVPLDGPVTVGWGGSTPRENYHVVAPDQTGAYDLLVTVDGSTHRGEGKKLEDYYIYDRAILAPADGEVVATVDGDLDMPVGELGGGSNPGGNQVVLRVAEGQYLFLCHMKPGTVAVKKGDSVKQGDTVGRVGNSGNTGEPHLHVHLQSTPELGFGEGIPMPFHSYRTADGRHVDRGIPTGGITPDGKLRGAIITHDPPAEASAPAEPPILEPAPETPTAP